MALALLPTLSYNSHSHLLLFIRRRYDGAFPHPHLHSHPPTHIHTCMHLIFLDTRSGNASLALALETGSSLCERIVSLASSTNPTVVLSSGRCGVLVCLVCLVCVPSEYNYIYMCVCVWCLCIFFARERVCVCEDECECHLSHSISLTFRTSYALSDVSSSLFVPLLLLLLLLLVQVLLNMLDPKDRRTWLRETRSCRAEYDKLASKYFVDPHEDPDAGDPEVHNPLSQSENVRANERDEVSVRFSSRLFC
jgi:hypothetical protein